MSPELIFNYKPHWARSHRRLHGRPLHKWEKGTESVVLSPSKHNRRSPFDKLRATYLSYATVSLHGAPGKKIWGDFCLFHREFHFQAAVYQQIGSATIIHAQAFSDRSVDLQSGEWSVFESDVACKSIRTIGGIVGFPVNL